MTISRITLSLLLFTTTSCTIFFEQETPEQVKANAIEDAGDADIRLCMDFLECLPLEREERKTCRKKKWSRDSRLTSRNPKYAIQFIYECEKRAFTHTIRNSGNQCTGIDNRIKPDQQSQAYRLECTDSNVYLAQFDSKSKQWLVK